MAVKKIFDKDRNYTNKMIQTYVDNKRAFAKDFFDEEKLEMIGYVEAALDEYEEYAKGRVDGNDEVSKDSFQKAVDDMDDYATKANYLEVTKLKFDDTDKNKIERLITDGDSNYKEMMSDLIVFYENFKISTRLQDLEIANQYLVDEDIKDLLGRKEKANWFYDYESVLRDFIEGANELLKGAAKDDDEVISFIKNTKDLIDDVITTSKEAIKDNDEILPTVAWNYDYTDLRAIVDERSESKYKGCGTFKKFDSIFDDLESAEDWINESEKCEDYLEKLELFNEVGDKQY